MVTQPSLAAQPDQGDVDVGEIGLVRSVTKQVEGRTSCALGDAAAWPSRGFILQLRQESGRRFGENRGRTPEAVE